MTKLLLARALWEDMALAASVMHPLEEGGILLGSVDAAGDRLVTHTIGSGPRARRSRSWLEVDHDWQNDRIRELHEGGRKVAYVGEWHSHPDATSGRPSRQDRLTLARLADFGPLSCRSPVMVILYPGVEGWAAQGWGLADWPGRLRSIAGPAVRQIDLHILADGSKHLGS